MTDAMITVQGSSSIRHAAERATVSLAVSHDGPHHDGVFASTSESAQTITTALDALHNAADGPVVAWSSDRIAVWSDRPWSNEGVQLPLVHHATIGIRASFVDFDVLARWVEVSAATSGASVVSIDWELHETTREQLIDEMRTKAVQDAAAKALVYALAAGLTSVTATAIAEPGMLGITENGSPGFMAASSPRTLKAGETLKFTPAELEIEARVDARFLAR